MVVAAPSPRHRLLRAASSSPSVPPHGASSPLGTFSPCPPRVQARAAMTGAAYAVAAQRLLRAPPTRVVTHGSVAVQTRSGAPSSLLFLGNSGSPLRPSAGAIDSPPLGRQGRPRRRLACRPWRPPFLLLASAPAPRSASPRPLRPCRAPVPAARCPAPALRCGLATPHCTAWRSVASAAAPDARPRRRVETGEDPTQSTMGLLKQYSPSNTPCSVHKLFDQMFQRKLHCVIVSAKPTDRSNVLDTMVVLCLLASHGHSCNGMAHSKTTQHELESLQNPFKNKLTKIFS
ncbi:hypothetical protein BS78_09G063600 [Paspalum vaginatum]|nr:hypothetical protein BS78_09G063600 [Paspalum vaginatum]